MKVFAIIEGWIDDEYNLTLIPDPDKYNDQEVVYTEVDREVPTTFYDLFDILEEWTPYNGRFAVDEIYGNIDENGIFHNDDKSEICFTQYKTYHKGEMIDIDYEELG